MFEYGVLTQVTCHLQMVLNTTHLDVGADKFDQYDHVTPVLCDVLCLCLKSMNTVQDTTNCF